MTCTKTNLLNYLAAFDGGKKDFSQVEHLFDALYHDPFRAVASNGKKITRRQVQRLHAKYLSSGYKAELVAFRWIGLESVYVNVRLTNDQEVITSREVYTTLGGQLVKSWALNDTFQSLLKAKCGSHFSIYYGALLSTEHLETAKKPDEYGTEYENDRLFEWTPTPSGSKYEKVVSV
ncbi:hypothetical protein ACHAXT_001610 [Thalassiosira profunda]